MAQAPSNLFPEERNRTMRVFEGTEQDQGKSNADVQERQKEPRCFG
jgi:hypothetical protein